MNNGLDIRNSLVIINSRLRAKIAKGRYVVCISITEQRFYFD